jgi:hypothetical protein
MAGKLAIPAPTLSFHLKELQQVGLAAVAREGRFLNYTANFSRMNELVGFLTENCCSLSDGTCSSECEPAAARPARKRA